MNKKPLLSIVMPVYKVEPYLNKAIKSVLNQSFKDFEIILVDDASPDNCPQICDEYAKAYKNIIAVHHSENQGLSAARNTGLDYVQGEYVTFMDSDDYVDNTLFEKVYDSLCENMADCVVFGVREEYCDKFGNISKIYDLVYGEEVRISERNELRNAIIELENRTFLGYAWNKFYKTSLINENELRFEKVTLIEDIVFNVHFFEMARSLNILNIAPYHYIKRIDGSLTNRFVKDYYILHRRRVSEILELYVKWDMCNDEIKHSLGNIYARYIFSALQRNCDKRSGMNRNDRKEFLESVFNDELFKELSSHIKIGGYAGILYGFLKNRKLRPCLAFGRIIYFVKNKMPTIFAAVKQKR